MSVSYTGLVMTLLLLVVSYRIIQRNMLQNKKLEDENEKGIYKNEKDTTVTTATTTDVGEEKQNGRNIV